MRIGILCVIALLLTLPLLAQEATQPVAMAPKVIATPEATAVFTAAPTRWPHFYDWDPTNQACGTYVDTTYSNKRQAPIGTPRPLYFGYLDDVDASGNPVFTHVPTDAEYRPVDGLRLTIDLNELELGEYRKSAKLLVTYSIRLEGGQQIIGVERPHDPYFCQGWHGVSKQEFPKGEAYTRVFVNGQAWGSPSIMTIPSAGKGQINEEVDPTHTGQLTLLPEDFGGELPQTIIIEVKAYNDTAMVVTSPANMRNLIVTINPTN